MTSQLRTRLRRLLGAGTGIALAVGLSAVVIAAPAQAATQDGVYVGENSHGYDITITVSDGKVTDVATTSTIFCGLNPPIPSPLTFNDIPDTAIAADGTFQANWTYQIDADYHAEYWLGGTFHDDGTVTSSGSNAADMVGAGLQCTGTQFTYDAAVDGTPAPQITVNPNPATLSQITDPAGVVRFTGTGFAPDSSVALLVDGQQAATRTAGADGSVEVILHWPNATVGDHVVKFTSGARTAQTTFTVVADPTYTPTAAVSPSTTTVSALAGAGVSVTGAGFPPSAAVTIAFDGTTVTTVDSGADGSVGYALSRAAVAPGAHTITLTSGQWSASAALTVEADPVVYHPAVLVTPDTISQSELASAGIQVQGSGFPENAPVEVLFDGAVVTTAITSDTGAVATSVLRSGVAAGTSTVLVRSGQWQASDTVVVTADPIDPADVTLTPSEIATGALEADGIALTAEGLPAEVPVRVLFDGTQVATFTASATGTGSASFTVPDVAPGRHTVQLVQGPGFAPRGEALAAFAPGDVLGEAELQVTADPASPGLVLSVSRIATDSLAATGVQLAGTGFTPGQAVAVLFDGQEVGAALADASGSVSFTLRRAGVAPGDHPIALTQGDLRSEAVLTVTAASQPGTPGPGTSNPGTPGQAGGTSGGLAATGTDAGLWTGVAGAALALMAAGALIVVRRRRA